MRTPNPTAPPPIPPAFKKKLRCFLNLKSEQDVLRALADTGAILTSGAAFNGAKLTAQQREEFRRSWALTTDDELDEALSLAGLITVMHGDLAKAARAAKYPLTVAKAIVAVLRGSEDQLRRVVPVLRQRGCSWTQIGNALGMTKQSAWEGYSGEE